MANTYDWTFTLFETAPSQDSLSDVVIVVHWRLTATDPTGAYVVSSYGTATLQSPDPAEFTPFDQITKDQTIEWVSGVIDAAAAKEYLDSQITALIDPPVVPKLPPFGTTSQI